MGDGAKRVRTGVDMRALYTQLPEFSSPIDYHDGKWDDFCLDYSRGGLLAVAGVAEHVAQGKDENTQERCGGFIESAHEADEAQAVDGAGEEAVEPVGERVFLPEPLAGAAGVDVNPGEEDGAAY